jgi:hypothetical protein
MAASEPSRVRAPEPPKNFDHRNLPTARVPVQSWWRLHDRNFPEPIYWSRSGKYRFDSPGAPFGVFYSGLDLTTAFLEVFGDKVRHSRRLALSQIRRYEIRRVTVPASLKVLILEGSNLAKAGATMGCFSGSYPLSQRWGAAFMNHGENMDGLVYIGRRSGARCLALFGDDKHPKKHQASLIVEPVEPLVDSLEFWQIADELELAVY